MSTLTGGVKTKSSSKHRRERVIKRLEAQLESGRKTWATKQAAQQELIDYQDDGIRPTSKLTESDIKRIKKELATLKTRV